MPAFFNFPLPSPSVLTFGKKQKGWGKGYEGIRRDTKDTKQRGILSPSPSLSPSYFASEGRTLTPQGKGGYEGQRSKGRWARWTLCFLPKVSTYLRMSHQRCEGKGKHTVQRWGLGSSSSGKYALHTTVCFTPKSLSLGVGGQKLRNYVFIHDYVTCCQKKQIFIKIKIKF